MTIDINPNEFNIRLYSKSGRRLCELSSHGEVEWVLNGYGAGSFEISANDPNFDEEKLAIGNFAMLSHKTAGFWGGVLLGPRDWYEGRLVIGMVGAAFQFSRRRGPQNTTWKGSAGAIARSILSWGNGQGPMNIQEGIIFTGGDQARTETSKFALLNKSIDRIQQRSGNDWQVRPEENEHNDLVFYFDWSERLGVETNLILEKSVNIELTAGQAIMREIPDIVNDDLCYSQTVKPNTPQPYDSDFDQTSIDDYGLSQFAQGDASDQKATLKSKAQSVVAAKKRPRREYNVTAVDVLDTFEKAREGNISILRLPGIGFRSESSLPLEGDGKTGSAARVRIKRRKMATRTGRMALTLEEIYT